MPAGRPPKYKSASEIQKNIDAYFSEDDEPTITGLALALGFNSRQSLLNYEGKQEFVDAIKRAKSRVEHSYEKSLRKDGGAGNIFALKNFGWSDKQEMEHTGKDGGPIVLWGGDGSKNNS